MSLIYHNIKSGQYRRINTDLITTNLVVPAGSVVLVLDIILRQQMAIILHEGTFGKCFAESLDVRSELL